MSVESSAGLTKLIVNIPTELVGRILVMAGQQNRQATDVAIQAIEIGMRAIAAGQTDHS